MNVLAFPSKSAEARGWQKAELQRLLGTCQTHLESGQISAWEFGETDNGDPQLYVLGPKPEQDCILSISRIGRLYIVEDGNGRLMFEHHNLLLLAERVVAFLSSRKRAILLQIGLAWVAVRELFEEKIEPVVAESAEIVTHFVPQLAVLI